MNIFLWILQGLIAVHCVMGSVWRFMNYEQAAKDLASLQALPATVWHLVGVFEIVCSLALLLPGILGMKPEYTPIAALCLVVEMLLLSALHMKYFGFSFTVTNPAVWTLGLALLSAVVAYGRFVVAPL